MNSDAILHHVLSLEWNNTSRSAARSAGETCPRTETDKDHQTCSTHWHQKKPTQHWNPNRRAHIIKSIPLNWSVTIRYIISKFNCVCNSHKILDVRQASREHWKTWIKDWAADETGLDVSVLYLFDTLQPSVRKEQDEAGISLSRAHNPCCWPFAARAALNGVETAQHHWINSFTICTITAQKVMALS